jgi:hypothetical protein
VPLVPTFLLWVSFNVSVSELDDMKLLAELGHARAQTSLGFMYYSGLGTPVDYKSAVKWYRAFAVQGDVECTVRLSNVSEYANNRPRRRLNGWRRIK